MKLSTLLLLLQSKATMQKLLAFEALCPDAEVAVDGRTVIVEAPNPLSPLAAHRAGFVFAGITDVARMAFTTSLDVSMGTRSHTSLDFNKAFGRRRDGEMVYTTLENDAVPELAAVMRGPGATKKKRRVRLAAVKKPAAKKKRAGGPR